MAHAFVALCHSPNYNFKGEPYYNSKIYAHEINLPDDEKAERHSRMAVEKAEELRKIHLWGGRKKKKKGCKPTSSKPTTTTTTEPTVQPQIISPVETCNPGVNADLADELVGRPYANAMRKVYQAFSDDAEVTYLFAEALMVLNAWELFEYPTGKPKTRDVLETSSMCRMHLPNIPTMLVCVICMCTCRKCQMIQDKQ